MALDQSALLNLLGELKLTDVTDRIRVATETLYQELIDAEATALIGAVPFERSLRAAIHSSNSSSLPETTGARLSSKRIPSGTEAGIGCPGKSRGSG